MPPRPVPVLFRVRHAPVSIREVRLLLGRRVPLSRRGTPIVPWGMTPGTPRVVCLDRADTATSTNAQRAVVQVPGRGGTGLETLWESRCTSCDHPETRGHQVAGVMIKAHHHGLSLRTTRQPHRPARAGLQPFWRWQATSAVLTRADICSTLRGTTWRACRRPVCLLSHGLAAREPALWSRRSKHGCWYAVWPKGQRAQRSGEGVCAFHSEDG
jgi:hypothetical protein